MHSPDRPLLASLALVSLLLSGPTSSAPLDTPRLAQAAATEEVTVTEAPKSLAEQIALSLSQGSQLDLPAQSCLLDPFAWELLRTDSTLTAVESSAAQLNLPEIPAAVRAEGRLVDSEGIKALTSALRARLEGSKTLQIRLANSEEMEYTEAIGGQLDGPLVTVVSDTGRWVFRPRGERMEIHWLDPEATTLSDKLSRLSELPLSRREPDLLQERLLDDPSFTMPTVSESEPLKLLLFTDESLARARVLWPDFEQYLSDLAQGTVDGTPGMSGRVLVQGSFNAKGETLVYVTHASGPLPDLEHKLRTVAAPTSRGPVSFVLAIQL